MVKFTILGSRVDDIIITGVGYECKRTISARISPDSGLDYEGLKTINTKINNSSASLPGLLAVWLKITGMSATTYSKHI